MNTKSRLLFLSILFSVLSINSIIGQEDEEQSSDDQKEFQKLDFYNLRGTNAIDLGIGGSTLFGDYEDTSIGFYYRAGYKRALSPYIFAGLTANGFNFSYNDIDQSLLSVDFNLEYLFIPTEMFTPLIYGGLGMSMDSETDVSAMKAQVGFSERDADYRFLNFLLKPARPISPEPRRSMIVGSGTGLGSTFKTGP